MNKRQRIKALQKELEKYKRAYQSQKAMALHAMYGDSYGMSPRRLTEVILCTGRQHGKIDYQRVETAIMHAMTLEQVGALRNLVQAESRVFRGKKP